MPDGGDPRRLMTIERGTADYMMRVRFASPSDGSFVLSDVLVDDEPLRYASQIAEKMTIRIRGLAVAASSPAPEIPCDRTKGLEGVVPHLRA